MFSLMIFIVFLDLWLNLGLVSDEAARIFISPLIIIFGLLLFVPVIRKEFVKWFVLDKKRMDKVICYPIIASIILGFAINIYRFIPFWLGYDVVGIGKNQVTILEDVSDFGMALAAYVIAPFSEEFAFRFLAFVGVALMIKDFVKGTKWEKKAQLLFVERRKLILAFWVLFTGAIFSVMHGPGVLNFPLYLIGGVVNAYFFLRFGFLSAWISHGTFNFFSGIALTVIMNFTL